MSSVPTFRDCIEKNKRCVLSYLEGKGFRSTGEISDLYLGENDIYQTRKALKELEKEGKIIFKKRGINSKYWSLKNYGS